MQVTAAEVLRCGDAIDGVRAPDATYQVLLGAVALPTRLRSPALQTAPTGNGGEVRLFAEAGLLIRAGRASRLSVPAELRGRVAFGWGNPGRPARRLDVPRCPSTRGVPWLAFAGGYYTPDVICARLTVVADGREASPELGIGTACPGQRPPQGPSVT